MLIVYNHKEIASREMRDSGKRLPTGSPLKASANPRTDRRQRPARRRNR